MAIVPGSGAIITPVFNLETLTVDSVRVEDGGSGYDPEQPPNLIIQNCGTPTRDAVLEPVIQNGVIIAVKVLDGGEGYDPLRIQFSYNLPEDYEEPDEASAKIILKEDGSIDYIQVLKSGDGYFFDVNAEIVGGGGVGAELRAVSKSVTGLSILNAGRGYETTPFLSITGGGGTGATGAAEVDLTGIVSPDISISNPGQFYLQEPYILFIGGGGSGAKGKAVINQGSLTDIVVTDPGQGYTTPPQIVFTRQAKLKRVSRNRQAYNLRLYNLTGLTADVNRNSSTIYVSSTDAYPGSGILLLEKELIRYTGKDAKRFTGCTRGINFRYDQRVVLDDTQNDPDTNISTYKFNVGDRIVRTLESASSKIAIVYDWRPETQELFIVFQVDELAFIDAGSPADKSAIAFDAGIADSTDSFQLPHVILDVEGEIIYVLTSPPGIEIDKAFKDDAELGGDGDGYPDLINTGTDYENRINLDGGIPSTLYGIEETVGGTNTTLFDIGDQMKDSSDPFKVATVVDAGQLDEGIEHYAKLKVTMDVSNSNYYNNLPFVAGETVIGVDSLIQATVSSWDEDTFELILEDIIPYDTGNPDYGILYEFSSDSTIVDIRILDPGLGYGATAPNVVIPSSIVSSTATAVLTADQVTSVNMNIGGYGYTSPPSISFSGGTGSGVVAQAILGGEKLSGTNGASWRIKSIEYLTILRDDVF